MRRTLCFLCLTSCVIVSIFYSNFQLINYFDKKSFISKDLLKESYPFKKIEIWSKASVGDFLWLHILGGSTCNNSNFMKVGTLHLAGIEFTFRSGPGYIQTTLPQDVTHLVLVINGRTSSSSSKSKQWLDYLPKLKKLKKVAVLMLGNERCENDWILPYLRSNGGCLDLIFLIYDSSLVDNREVFQWPLGVAMYRGFPKISYSETDSELIRPYKCNFVGTVYENSSRQIVEKILTSPNFHHNCYLNIRKKWLPNETKATLSQYIHTLLHSDLTLNPVGKNAECYRIYESMACGSVPVVEDNRTYGKCSTPLRLLKKFSAPIIYIRDWNMLDNILLIEKNMSHLEVVNRRIGILHWYKNFKANIGDQFLRIIKNKFNLE